MMIVAGNPVCSLCMEHLTLDGQVYTCPKHGARPKQILDEQVVHYNQNAGKGGTSKSSGKGRKRKKPKKMTPWWAGNVLES